MKSERFAVNKQSGESSADYEHPETPKVSVEWHLRAQNRMAMGHLAIGSRASEAPRRCLCFAK